MSSIYRCSLGTPSLPRSIKLKMTTRLHLIAFAIAISADSVLSDSCYPHSSQINAHPLVLSSTRSNSHIGGSLSSSKSGRARISSHHSHPGENHLFSSFNSELDVISKDADMDLLNHFPHSLTPPSSSSESNGMLLHEEAHGGDEIYLTIDAMNDAHIPHQNDNLSSKQNHKYLKTGTTIVGVQIREGIILAADTRATEGTVVADKRCEKVHQLSHNVWCCGAGTSGDLDALTRKVRYTFLLKNMMRDCVGNDGLPINVGADEETRFQSEEEIDINQSLGEASISSICHMIRDDLTKGGGQIGANLVLGGVDPFTKQPVLTSIHPHGSIDVVPYTALGSGGLAAMGVLEAGYKVGMTMEEGVKLVKNAVLAGINNDLGSGSQVDMVIITPTRVKYERAIVTEEKLVFSSDDEYIENELYRRHAISSDAKTVGGVNGFGSLPYQIKSGQVALLDEEIAAERKQTWLNNIFSA